MFIVDCVTIIVLPKYENCSIKTIFECCIFHVNGYCCFGHRYLWKSIFKLYSIMIWCKISISFLKKLAMNSFYTSSPNLCCVNVFIFIFQQRAIRRASSIKLKMKIKLNSQVRECSVISGKSNQNAMIILRIIQITIP